MAAAKKLKLVSCADGSHGARSGECYTFKAGVPFEAPKKDADELLELKHIEKAE